MNNIKTYKSDVVDVIIGGLEAEAKRTRKHLIKTETILSRLRRHIDLSDDDPSREELLEIGAKQTIQSRLYSLGYFSIMTGFFVKLIECDNLTYLSMMLKNKDNTIEKKVIVRNRIKELKGLAGQMVFVPDEQHNLCAQETKTVEELLTDIEADAV